MQRFAHLVCVWDRVTLASQHISHLIRSLCVCVCVCVRERETSHHSGVYCQSEMVLNRSLFANTYEHHHSVCHAILFPSRVELMVKRRTLLTIFNFESWRSELWKALHYRHGLWCSANHNALCQLDNQSRLHLSERRGFVEKQIVWERRDIKYLQ